MEENKRGFLLGRFGLPGLDPFRISFLIPDFVDN